MLSEMDSQMTNNIIPEYDIPKDERWEEILVELKKSWVIQDYLKSELYQRTIGIPEMYCDECGAYQDIKEILIQQCSCKAKWNVVVL